MNTCVEANLLVVKMSQIFPQVWPAINEELPLNHSSWFDLNSANMNKFCKFLPMISDHWEQIVLTNMSSICFPGGKYYAHLPSKAKSSA